MSEPDAARIRDATVDDARDIASVHVLSWRSAYRDQFPAEYLASLRRVERAAKWREILGDSGVDTFVAVVDSWVIGF